MSDGPSSPERPPQGPRAPLEPERPPGYRGPVPAGGPQQPPTGLYPWAGAPLSGWWRRAGALLIDGLILTVLVGVLVAIVVPVAIGSDVAGVIVGVLAFFLYLVVALLYAPVLMARSGERNGQTWGRQAVGIRVVRDTGEAIGFGYAVLRELVVKTLLFGVVGGFFASIPTIIDYLWPLWDDENRALHDMIVKSHVLRT
jgi:uncharacterized RDD family membrane protein YckC